MSVQCPFDYVKMVAWDNTKSRATPFKLLCYFL
uniref:Uncharacterized protein n=1 Tax=Siphoviridae sp. ctGQT3 TaxID=2825412 RepID=A0A8S5UE42_9CAUD|nr:MAG TPA: hypothetical protein [Siphoviridae sp. ctGQT3]